MTKTKRYWVVKFYDGGGGYESGGRRVETLGDACWYESHDIATMQIANRDMPARPVQIEQSDTGAVEV